jgi:hypothetical protein
MNMQLIIIANSCKLIGQEKPINRRKNPLIESIQKKNSIKILTKKTYFIESSKKREKLFMPTIKKLLRNIITATNLVEKMFSLFVIALSYGKSLRKQALYIGILRLFMYEFMYELWSSF